MEKLEPSSNLLIYTDYFNIFNLKILPQNLKRFRVRTNDEIDNFIFSKWFDMNDKDSKKFNIHINKKNRDNSEEIIIYTYPIKACYKYTYYARKHINVLDFENENEKIILNLDILNYDNVDEIINTHYFSINRKYNDLENCKLLLQLITKEGEPRTISIDKILFYSIKKYLNDEETSKNRYNYSGVPFF